MAETPESVYQLARKEGLDSEAAVVAVAVAWAESGLNAQAMGDLTLQDSKWGPSVGLWQIRSLKAQRGTGEVRDQDRLTDPAFNAHSMASISDGGTNWQPWSVWRSGAYLKYVEQVRRAVEVKLVSRDEWGARPPVSTTPIGSALRGVACHWEGPHMGTPEHDRCTGLVQGIQRFHMDTNGWNDIAYNAVVCPHGYVFEGRGPGVRSAANGDQNVNSTHYAVCFLGGDGDTFTEEARQGYNDAAVWLDIADGEWVGHRDLTQTACPGDEIYEWVHSGHSPSGGDVPPPPPPVTEDVLKDDERNALLFVAAVVTELKEVLTNAGDGDYGTGLDRLTAVVKAQGNAGGVPSELKLSGTVQVSS